MAKFHRNSLLLTVPLAAKALGISAARLRRALARDQIPSVTVGEQKMVVRAAIERLAQVEKVTS